MVAHVPGKSRRIHGKYPRPEQPEQHFHVPAADKTKPVPADDAGGVNGQRDDRCSERPRLQKCIRKAFRRRNVEEDFCACDPFEGVGAAQLPMEDDIWALPQFLPDVLAVLPGWRTDELKGDAGKPPDHRNEFTDSLL